MIDYIVRPDSSQQRVTLALPWSWWPSLAESRAAEQVPVIHAVCAILRQSRPARGAEA